MECARLLINSGANMTARMRSACLWFNRMSNSQACRSGIIPLHVAAASGHKDVVQLFLQRGVQIDFQYPERLDTEIGMSFLNVILTVFFSAEQRCSTPLEPTWR